MQYLTISTSNNISKTIRSTSTGDINLTIFLIKLYYLLLYCAMLRVTIITKCIIYSRKEFKIIYLFAYIDFYFSSPSFYWMPFSFIHPYITAGTQRISGTYKFFRDESYVSFTICSLDWYLLHLPSVDQFLLRFFLLFIFLLCFFIAFSFSPISFFSADHPTRESFRSRVLYVA